MKEHNCDNCSMRSKFDSKPKSLVGRFWRWHINFCPGWKAYFNDLDESSKQELRIKYNLKNS
ncbi:hypothetical protein [Labilibacter marinus]|uniref:hypothetical protein n=1 Tax=Labilibacter marinus TaxID=1477105 RepID=UPI00094FA287|nr:hypothetical protein [Labilibacter marinus]